MIKTLIKHQGVWRLYLNTPMGKTAGLDVGQLAVVTLQFDPVPRIEPMPKLLKEALQKNRAANQKYQSLTPSRQKEICRYLNSAKTETTLTRNVQTVVQHLVGKNPKLLRPIMRKR